MCLKLLRVVGVPSVCLPTGSSHDEGVFQVQSRNTRQKEAIRTAFLTEDRPLSPEETLTYAQEQVEGISIATIYRNISTLVEERWLTPVSIPGESARYEIAGKGHHHHFRCNQCGKVYEMPGCGLNGKPKLPRGFRATSHEFFIFGVCSECK
jgi:Fur family transcriptional regulator, ferric uptake regulator